MTTNIAIIQRRLDLTTSQLYQALSELDDLRTKLAKTSLNLKNYISAFTTNEITDNNSSREYTLQNESYWETQNLKVSSINIEWISKQPNNNTYNLIFNFSSPFSYSLADQSSTTNKGIQHLYSFSYNISSERKSIVYNEDISLYKFDVNGLFNSSGDEEHYYLKKISSQTEIDNNQSETTTTLFTFGESNQPMIFIVPGTNEPSTIINGGLESDKTYILPLCP